MMVDRYSASSAVHIVSAARTWIGTPYFHQASCKGVGADCLGLVRGVWREVVGPEPVPIESYSLDWADTTDGENLLDGLAKHFLAIPSDAAKPGDVLACRMPLRGPVRHVAILTERELADPAARMIHVCSGHVTCEVHLSHAWRRRLACVFRYPMPA